MSRPATRAGKMFYIPPRPHDSRVAGEEPYVSLHLLGADHYAKQEDVMKRAALFAAVLVLSAASAFAQSKPVLVINEFTAASGVELPYDLKQLRGQLVAEFKVILGKDFTIAADAPAAADGSVYTLDAVITGWRPGNAAKRLLVGMGSGRESSDLQYHVTDREGKKVVDRKDTIRTNFYSQSAGSTGTLAHPIAQKIADRIKDAKLR